MNHTQLIRFPLLAFVLFGLMVAVQAPPVSQAASQEAVKKEVREAASAIGAYSVEQKDKAIAEAKELLETLDQHMQEADSSMQTNWHTMKESAKEHYQRSQEDLKEQRKELAHWLDKMQNSSADAWEETKKGFADAHESLHSSWKKAVEKVRGE